MLKTNKQKNKQNNILIPNIRINLKCTKDLNVRPTAKNFWKKQEKLRMFKECKTG